MAFIPPVIMGVLAAASAAGTVYGGVKMGEMADEQNKLAGEQKAKQQKLESDLAVKDAADQKATERAAKLKAIPGGMDSTRGGTLLTGPMGVAPGAAYGQRKTLLGQ